MGKPALSNEIIRMSQGTREVKGNDAIHFVPRSSINKYKKVAYANMICDHRPLKTKVNRVRLTIGGDVLDYPGDKSSPASSLMEEKLVIKLVIIDSHLGANFMSLDIKDYFVQYFLDDPEYLRVHSKYFMIDIQKKYNIASLIASDGYTY